MNVSIRARVATPDGRRADSALSRRGRETSTLGTMGQTLLALQQSVGNRAVSQLVAEHFGAGSAAYVSLHGKTRGDYDGGLSKVSPVKVVPAKGCDCPDGPCYSASATLQVTYSVDVTIGMPDVPSGLTDCQEKRVRAFLRDVLGPHEKEHARRIRTYNGVTKRPFSAKGCGQEAAIDAAQTKAQEMHDSEAEKRKQDAETLSLAIDPFNRQIDLDC